MTFKQITPRFHVAGQLSEADVDLAAAQGFRVIICNRPDDEEPGQLSAATIAAAAGRHGMAFVHVPVRLELSDASAAKMEQALKDADGPVLAYCRLGSRAARLGSLALAGDLGPDRLSAALKAAGYEAGDLMDRLSARFAEKAGTARRFDVVVIGGGAAGIATAASLRRRRSDLQIAIVDPAETHNYQPGWTMVGGGIFTAESTTRPMADVIPRGVTWIAAAAERFRPEENIVILADGRRLEYAVLVLATGLVLDWQAIPGLSEALGKNGVTSNYRRDLAPYTASLVKQMRKGRAIFTQPPMPIKCAGAPQKALYLSCDAWRRAGVLKDVSVSFHTATPGLFGVAAYVPALMTYIERYGVDLNLGSRLVALDGASRTATFEKAGPDGAVQRRVERYDMIHVCPPQVAPQVIKDSPFAGADGFVEVDPATLRALRYPNVFALGDVAGTTNAKTAAAARKQAPVVAVNVLAALQGTGAAAAYDGYGSCPLTVERGRIVLAEFGYGGTLLPTFPKWLLDGTRPSRLAWILKAKLLPAIYWNAMLKGKEWLARPRRHA